MRRALLTAALALAVGVPVGAQAALPDPARRSNGQATVLVSRYLVDTYSFTLSGFIRIGAEVFHGDARGSYQVHPSSASLPFVLGSVDGNLRATCTDHTGVRPPGTELAPTPTAGTIDCVGHVGAGPDAAFTLHVVLPVASRIEEYHAITNAYDGRFAG
jgi:hypothetical protein